MVLNQVQEKRKVRKFMHNTPLVTQIEKCSEIILTARKDN